MMIHTDTEGSDPTAENKASSTQHRTISATSERSSANDDSKRSLLASSFRDAKERFATSFHRRAIGVGCLRNISITYNITHGQLVLLLPLVLCALVCNHHTFFKPNTGQSGTWAYYTLVYAFLLAHKKASLFRLIGVSWEQLVPIHYAASVTALVLSALHSYVAYTGHDYIPCREPTAANLLDTNSTVPFCEDLEDYGHRNLGELRLEDNARYRHSQIGPEPDVWKYLWDGGRNVSGSWMWACLLSLILLSAFRTTLRRPSFDLWLALHIAASGAILAYSFKHRVGLYVVLSIWWGLDGILRYGWDALARLPKTARMTLISHRPKKGQTKANLNDALVELTFKQKFTYQAGQYVRVAVVETGQPVMFHPMTISSAPFEDKVTIHIRPFGGWTRQLVNMSSNHTSKRSSVEVHPDEDAVGRDVHVLLEGPYGCLSMNLWNGYQSYQTVILIAGGIGVTPISSLARQLLHEHKHEGRHRKRIHVVWSVRDLKLVEALPLLGNEGDLLSGLRMPPNNLESTCDSAEMCSATSGTTYEPIHFTADVYLTTDSNTLDIDEEMFELSNSVLLASPDLKDIEEDLENIDISSNLLGEGYALHSGRPDISHILRNDAASSTLQGDATSNRVAVIACGPRSLVQSTKEECARLTCDAVAFDFHEEIFLY